MLMCPSANWKVRGTLEGMSSLFPSHVPGMQHKSLPWRQASLSAEPSPLPLFFYFDILLNTSRIAPWSSMLPTDNICLLFNICALASLMVLCNSLVTFLFCAHVWGVLRVHVCEGMFWPQYACGVQRTSDACPRLPCLRQCPSL